MAFDEIKIRVLSVIVSSILSALGIINNDVYLMIAAAIISPIGPILYDLSKDIISLNANKSLLNISFLLLIVLCVISVGIAFGKITSDLSEDVIRKFKHQGWIFNSFIGLMLGMFTAYITSLNGESISSHLVGIGVALTILPTLADMGLRLGQKTLDNKLIRSDFEISLANAGSFLAGAMMINYLLSL